jgi:SPP1 family predicted phage head-tail adaptor
MKAGELRNQIQIYNLTVSPDGAGGTTPTYTLAQTLWAKIKAKTGKRDFEDSRISLDETYEIVIRYDDYPEFSQLDKIMFNNGLYVVQSFYTVEERKKTIIIYCTLDRMVTGNDFIMLENGTTYMVTE